MLGQRLGTDTHPPGLYVGLAGIARAFPDLGWEDRGEAGTVRAWSSIWPMRARAVSARSGRGSGTGSTGTWFRVENEDGIAFPGRWLNRIAHDYATGPAGIGTFLARLVSPGECPFVDL
ncbi:hypothetical protein ACFY0G_37170 [Streptomyces sp. NPDC001552]|uniref:hypothetical protein n=1 Tax=Streptomyces sp. NPDC001552 TaxID=3364587 RepID=UPI003695D194